MRLIRLMLMIIIAFIVGATFVYSDDPAEFQLTAAQKRLLLQKLDRQWERLFEPELKLKKGASVIETAAFALDAAAAGYSQSLAFKTVFDQRPK